MPKHLRFSSMILICCCRHFHFVCSKYSEENTAVPATNIVKTINIDYHLGKLPKNKMPKHMENSICFVVFISVSFPYMQIIEEVTLEPDWLKEDFKTLQKYMSRGIV